MTAETINQRKLRQAIVDAFDESELKTLCFDLNVDYDTLPLGNKVDKARGLIALCLRDQRVDELISLCESNRPRIAWREMMTTAVADTDPPFMGLKYFDADHADLFFGRETLTTELTAHLQNNNFLAVVGASGSGKSSLVRAGLVPSLHAAQPNLKIHTFTPTDQPLEALATTLTRHTESIGVTAKFIDALASDPRSLHLAARRLVQDDEQLLLVIDQFEELFTLCRSEAKRQAFVANLVTAVSPENDQSAHHPTRAVIALRADFYHHCAQYDALRALLETQQRYIGAMSPTELRRAIELPAQQNGLTFEDGLVDLLLRDVGAGGDQPPEPGALPLLSHALLETWRRREGRTLTFGGYTDAGGVQGAIAKTAESVFSQKLTPNQQAIARSIFLRLTELGEGTQDTRRRALISELLPASAAADEAQTVLNLLSAARLVTTDEETAEVAHEALIREWPTLRRWLDENRDDLRLHRHLTESAQEWQQLNHDPGELYRGARLEQAQEWAAQHEDELNDLEREFLAASLAAQEQAIAAAQAQQQRELAQAQELAMALTQAARRARNFNIALVVILLLVIGVAWAVSNAQNSQQKAELAAAESTVAAVDARETAVAADQLAIVSTTDALAAATANAQAVEEIALNQTRAADSDAAATAVALDLDNDADGLSLAQEREAETDPELADSDGDQLLDGIELVLGTNPLAADSDGDGRLDNVDQEPLRPFIQAANLDELQPVSILAGENSEPFEPAALAISANNNFVAAGRFDGEESSLPATLYLWHTLSEELVQSPQQTDSFNPVLAVGFNRNFEQVMLVTNGGVARWQLDETEQTLAFLQNPSTASNSRRCSAAISPDGSSTLFGERARWWYYFIEEASLTQIADDSQNYNTNACYTDAVFSANGTYFGMIEDEGEDESVFVGHTLFRRFARPFNKSVSGTIDMALSTDGNILALGFENGRVELYDYSERRGGPPLLYGLDAFPSNAHAVFSPDDTILATSSPENGIVRLWRVTGGEPLLELDAEAEGVTSLIFSQDGHFLLFSTTAGEVHVYGMPEVER
ncbi:MAG: hypothetical protein CL608_04125 [Anaerolineaceae bacterium]|nr:hypothetical protein [Anaerolineaceae bacterium]